MSLARRLILAVGALAGAAGIAAAQQSSPGLQWEHMRVSEILGREVRTAEGELRAIRDLVIDSRTRTVVYLAIGPAGGEGKDLPLYPVSALRSGLGSELRLILPEGSSSSGESAPQAHVRASQFLGRLVQDAAGKELGRIKDMAVRVADGALSFAVLEGKAESAPLRVPAEAFYDALTR